MELYHIKAYNHISKDIKECYIRLSSYNAAFLLAIIVRKFTETIVICLSVKDDNFYDIKYDEIYRVYDTSRYPYNKDMETSVTQFLNAHGSIYDNNVYLYNTTNLVKLKYEWLFYIKVKINTSNTIKEYTKIYKKIDSSREHISSVWEIFIMYIDRIDNRTYICNVETGEVGESYIKIDSEDIDYLEDDDYYVVHNPRYIGIKTDIVKDNYSDINIIFNI